MVWQSWILKLTKDGGLISKLCYLLFGYNFPFYLHYLIFALVFFKPLKKLLTNKTIQYFLAISPILLILLRVVRNDPFFFSDDFAHLSLVSRYSYGEILRMTVSPGGIWVGHRIFLGFFLFKIIYEIYGTTIQPYVFVVFLLNFLNASLFYSHAKRIIKNTTVQVLITMVFSTYYLTWISNIHELLGMLFVLLGLSFLSAYFKSGEKKHLWLLFTSYLLAIVSKEIAFLSAPAFLLIALAKTKNSYLDTIKKYAPLIVMFLVYLVFFAAKFLSYFEITKGVGYSMTLSLTNVFRNLYSYLLLMFPLKRGLVVVVILLLFGIINDFRKKKFEVSPYFLSYFLFLGPPLLFDSRVSFYYTYISSAFLLLAVGIVMTDVFKSALTWLRTKPAVFRKVASIYLVIFIFTFVFGGHIKLMDNCFLSCFPWKNEQKEKVLELAGIISSTLGTNEENYVINLRGEKDKLEIVLQSGIIQLFLEPDKAKLYNFIYEEKESALYVQKEVN